MPKSAPESQTSRNSGDTSIVYELLHYLRIITEAKLSANQMKKNPIEIITDITRKLNEC